MAQESANPAGAGLAIIHADKENFRPDCLRPKPPPQPFPDRSKFRNASCIKICPAHGPSAPSSPLRVKSALVRSGDRYSAGPFTRGRSGGNVFPARGRKPYRAGKAGRFHCRSRTVTGKTHQIRVHAAAIIFRSWHTLLAHGSKPRLFPCGRNKIRPIPVTRDLFHSPPQANFSTTRAALRRPR